MALSSKLFPAVLLLLLLAEMRPVQEAMAAECQRPCEKCTGACFDDEECSIMCRNEHYESGQCAAGDDHRCMCTKNCA